MLTLPTLHSSTAHLRSTERAWYSDRSYVDDRQQVSAWAYAWENVKDLPNFLWANSAACCVIIVQAVRLRADLLRLYKARFVSDMAARRRRWWAAAALATAMHTRQALSRK